MSGGYIRLNSEGPDDSSSVFKESEESEESGVFKVTVLNKEKSYEISSLTNNTTISELKILIASITGVDVLQQRLIYSGKRLDSDNKTLNDYKITKTSVIHLFPIPVANLVTPSNQTSPDNPSTVYNPVLGLTTNNSQSHLNSTHSPIHFDDLVSQHSREVKLWSFILVFLSAMAILDVISAALSNSLSKLLI
jgi:hypothetical protein